MSQLRSKRKWVHLNGKSVLPSEANIVRLLRHVRFVQRAHAPQQSYSITSSARPDKGSGSQTSHPSEDPRKTKMDDETLALLRRHGPVRVEIVLRIIPGVVQILDIRGVVAATHAARPADRRRTHTGSCIHRVVMMSPMRGQSGRSRESEDSKTDKNAFCHSQLL